MIGLILAIILALSFSKWHFQAAFIEHILWFFGWFFVGIGVMGRIWCSLYISGFKNAKLVTDGPYSYVEIHSICLVIWVESGSC